MALSATACPSCVFGAVSSQTLSFTYYTIHTVTVSVIPKITVYPEGPNATNYEYITQSLTETVGGGSNRNASKTFSDVNSITWNVGDATLTYPTTYIQYLGFDGAASTSGACLQGSDATPIALPSTTNAASFIYPLTAVGQMPLPTELVQYLDSLDAIAAEFPGDSLSGCAALDFSSSSGGCGGLPGQAVIREVRRAESQDSISNSTVDAPSSNGTQPASASLISGHATTSLSSTTSASAESRSMLSQSRLGSSNSGNQSSGATTFTSSQTGNSTSMGSTSAQSVLSCPAPSAPTAQTSTTENGPPQTLFTLKSQSPFPTRTGVGPNHLSNHKSVHVSSSMAVPAPSSPTYDHTSAIGITKVTGSPIVTYVTGPREPASASPQHTGITAVTTGPGDSTGRHGGHGESSPTHGSGSGGGSPDVFSFGHTQVTAKSGGGVVVGHTTLNAGHSITIGTGASKTTLALQTKGGSTHLIVDGTTYNARPGSGITRDSSPTAVSPFAVITTNGHTLTAFKSGSSVIVESGHSKATIAPGSAITFGGQTISAPRQGSSVVVNGKTTFLSAPLTTATEAVITTKGHTFTALDHSGTIVIEGGSLTRTISPGSVITFDGQTISAATKGTAVVVNGKTEKVTPTTEPVPAASGHTSAASRVGNRLTHSLTSLFLISATLTGFVLLL